MTALIVRCLLILYSINFHIAYGERIETIPTKIGNYTFDWDNELGSGGFGTVFKGTKVEGSGPGPAFIAIKLSNKPEPLSHDHNQGYNMGAANRVSEETILEVIEQEIKATTKLDLKGKKRDGFPTLFDSGDFKDRKYIAMELLGADLVKLRDSMTLTNVVIFAEQMLDRLEYIHGLDFAYADLKPENFAVDAKNVLNILGLFFPIAFSRHIDVTTFKVLTAPHLGEKFTYEDGLSYILSDIVSVYNARGTPNYISNRQQNANVVYARDDIESLGFVFYFMLSGMHPPWDGLKIADKVLMKKRTPVSELFPGCLKAFVFFIEFARSLSDTAEIDYNFFRNILREARYSHDIYEHAVLDELKQSPLPSPAFPDETAHVAPPLPISPPVPVKMPSASLGIPPTQTTSKPSPSPAFLDETAHVAPPLPISPPVPVVMPSPSPGIPPMRILGSPELHQGNNSLSSSPNKKYMHKGPCPFFPDISQVQLKQRSELFVNMSEIYARGIVYPLKLTNELTKKENKVRIFKIIEPGYITFVRVQKKNQNERSITHNEEYVYELLAPYAESPSIGVPFLLASGYQSCYFYTVTTLDDGEPLSEYLKRVRLSSKMIINLILEVLDVLKFLHGRNVMLLHFGFDMFWVLRTARERKIFVRDLSVAKPFRVNKVYADFDSHNPYDSKRFMSLKAHEGKRLYSRDDIESLAYLAMELFRNCNGTASTPHKTDDHLKQIKEEAQPTTPIEKVTDPIVIMLIYAKQLKLFDSINYDFLRTLIESHRDFDKNFDWLKEENPLPSVLNTIYSWRDWAGYSKILPALASKAPASLFPTLGGISSTGSAHVP